MSEERQIGSKEELLTVPRQGRCSGEKYLKKKHVGFLPWNKLDQGGPHASDRYKQRCDLERYVFRVEEVVLQ